MFYNQSIQDFASHKIYQKKWNSCNFFLTCLYVSALSITIYIFEEAWKNTCFIIRCIYCREEHHF